MEYRRSQSLGVIKCPCGKEIKKGEYGFVPVVQHENKIKFERTVCENCKNIKDQDGSFQPDPVARKGGLVSMNEREVNKFYWYVVTSVEGETDKVPGIEEKFPFRRSSFSQEVYGRGGIIGKISYRYLCDEVEKFLYGPEMKARAVELVKQPSVKSETRGYAIQAAPEEVRSI
jgi:hypothetical protein